MSVNFLGISCLFVKTLKKDEWILDTGAIDHMTPMSDHLLDLKIASNKPQISLPNGNKAHITHVGNLCLKNNLVLNNTLCVPSFEFNLIYVKKLIQDNDCFVTFYSYCCII